MICSARSSASATTTTASSCCPPTPASPATTSSTLLGLRDEVIEFEINPDRAYALSLRGVAREAALAVRRRRSATRPTGAVPPRPTATATRSSSTTRSAARSSWPARSPASTRPRRRPTWMARRIQLAGMRPISLAVDVTNYVMLELGRPIHGYDADKLAGPIRVRRARAGERLTTLDGTDRDALDRGPRRHRRLRHHRPRRRDGRRDHRDVGDARPTCCSRPRTGTPVVDVPHRQRRHKLTSEAGKRNERGVDPTICAAAADRVAELLDDVRRRHGRARRHRRRHAAGARRRSRSTPTCPPGSPAWTSPRTRRSPTCAAVGCAVDGVGDASLTVDPAAVAPRPHRPVRPGRGGRPDRRLRPDVPSVLPHARPRAAA